MPSTERQTERCSILSSFFSTILYGRPLLGNLESGCSHRNWNMNKDGTGITDNCDGQKILLCRRSMSWNPLCIALALGGAVLLLLFHCLNYEFPGCLFGGDEQCLLLWKCPHFVKYANEDNILHILSVSFSPQKQQQSSPTLQYKCS